MKPLRVMGIDPGLVTTGWAFLSSSDCQMGEMSPFPKSARGIRLMSIGTTLSELLGYYRPNLVAIEGVYVSQGRKGKPDKPGSPKPKGGGNRRSALDLARVAGVIEAAAARACGVVIEVAGTSAKKALTGNGRAEKDQMIRYAQLISGYPELTEHQADAFAVAFGAWLERKGDPWTSPKSKK